VTRRQREEITYVLHELINSILEKNLESAIGCWKRKRDRVFEKNTKAPLVVVSLFSNDLYR